MRKLAHHQKILVLMAALMPFPGSLALAYTEIQIKSLRSVCEEGMFTNDKPIEPKCLESVSNIKPNMGYVITISKPEGADFIVPNSHNFKPNQNKELGSKALIEKCKEWMPDEKLELKWKEDRDGAEGFMKKLHLPFRSPLFTIDEWKKEYYNNSKMKLTIMINANWYDVRGPIGFPHKSPCTNIYGLAVADGVVLSTQEDINIMGAEYVDEITNSEGEKIHKLMKIEGEVLDAIVFPQGKGSPKILRNSEIILSKDRSEATYTKEGRSEKIHNAVSGFIILEKETLPDSALQKSNNPGVHDSSARTAIGLDKTGTTMFIVVVQRGRQDNPSGSGILAKNLSELLKTLGAFDAINLDNSGSSQLIFQPNNGQEIQTLPGDTYSGKAVLRPIPLFLGVKSNMHGVAE